MINAQLSSKKRKRDTAPFIDNEDDDEDDDDEEEEYTSNHFFSPSSSSYDLQNRPYLVQATMTQNSTNSQQNSNNNNNKNSSGGGEQNNSTTSSDNNRSASSASGAKYHCNGCGKDITNKVRIKCAQCQDFDLCVDCFFVGVETAPHKNNHSYRIMDDLSAPLYTSRWSADEELLLLEGIEQFGLGNWLDISEHVGTKNRFECEYHYWTVYIDVPTFPVPPPRKAIVEDVTIKLDDVKKNDDGMLLCLEKDKPRVEKKRKLNTKLINMGAELEYMPLRGDFTVEFENEAEDLIAEMEITGNDSETERQRKLQMLSTYDFILDEREKRKRFALERGVITDWKNLTKDDKKRPKPEMELYEKYRRYARFTTPEVFSSLIESLIEERRIAKRIEQLQNYRRSGIMSLEQGEEKRESGLAKKTTTSTIGSVAGVLSLSSSMTRTQYHYVSRSKSASNRYRADYDGAFDIRLYPGAELLSQREREICIEIKMPPKIYLASKDALIRESFRLSQMGTTLNKKQACDLICNLTRGDNEEANDLSHDLPDRGQISVIYDFCVLSGWISSAAHHSSSSM